MSTIDQFKNNLIGGGARNNQFRVTGGFPANLITGIAGAASSLLGGVGGQVAGAAGVAAGAVTGSTAGNKLQFLCKSATIPSSMLGTVIVPYRGKELKVSGDRKFDTWNLTVINDTDFDLRKAFEQWSNSLSTHKSNIAVNQLNYMQDWMVEQLDRSGSVLQTYNMRGCWPSRVSEISLGYENTNVIEEFQIALEYQYWENSESTS